VSLLALALDPFPEESIHTGIASLFGVANIVLFNLDLDYFAASSKFNAFTHTWSLSVEEQFYVMFPIVVWFCFLTTRVPQKNARTLAWVLAGLSLVSVSSFFWLYEANQPAA
jgi:peptidoglycan/LPS O-acetylase OafA/YrhL